MGKQSQEGRFKCRGLGKEGNLVKDEEEDVPSRGQVKCQDIT